MSLKTDIVAQSVVVDQVKGLMEQKYRLEVQIEQLEHRLKLVEASLAENDVLTEKVAILLSESLALFGDEWIRRVEYYPDIWLGAMGQALVVAQPAKKK